MKKKDFDKNNELILGGVKVSDLIDKYGTPLYVFDKKRIIDTINSFKNALTKFYGNGMICYASKAFCCKKMYNLLSECGVGTDVVSGGELYTAKASKFDLSKIVFHGNNKSYDELKDAISSGVYLIVIDSSEEADEIDEIANNLKVKQKVLIRVNPSIEAHTHHYIQTSKVDSKFGFSIDNGDAENMILKVNQKKNLILEGLHCHIGSQIFEKKSFVLAAEKMSAFYKKLNDVYKISFNVLNLGGGFGIKYNDSDPDFNADTYSDYVKEISDSVINSFKNYNLNKPFLILEPGRSIVGEAGTTLYTVGNIKEIKGIKNYVSIDGGMFENPRFALYQARYTVLKANGISEKPKIKCTVAGKCCESGDIIAEDCMLPELRKGDYLAVKSTGAYNYSMASNYNRNLIPAAIFVENGKSELIIKRQTYEDITKFDL